MSNTDENSPPPGKPADAVGVAQVRLIAGSLAFGATFWAVFCAPALYVALLEFNLHALFILEPGYLVTGCYYWRAFGRPSPNQARGIWGCRRWCKGRGWVFFSRCPVRRMADSSKRSFSRGGRAQPFSRWLGWPSNPGGRRHKSRPMITRGGSNLPPM